MKKNISQLKLPAPTDMDPHPRLLLDGDGVHAGQGFPALLLVLHWMESLVGAYPVYSRVFISKHFSSPSR